METPERLAEGEVHVLRAMLSRPPLPVHECESLVLPEERERAARYHQQADRHRHLIGRAVLRVALGRLLDVAPAAVALRLTAFGKPSCDGGPSFNIAHSGDEVLVALASCGRLGVDVEAVRDLPDLFSVARASFVVAEVSALASQPPEAQLRHFYRIWSRKEAILKALGIGIGSLQSLEVSGDIGISNALRRMTLPDERGEAWVVRPLRDGDDSSSAVAWDQPLQRVVVATL